MAQCLICLTDSRKLLATQTIPGHSPRHQDSYIQNLIMLLPTAKRVFAGLFLLLTFVTISSQTLPTRPDEGIQIDAPAGGRVRIENQFGEAQVDVWSEKYISVSALTDPAIALVRSPVVILNRLQVLGITVVRRRTDPVTPIKLLVKIPEGTKVEIVTGKHAATIRGLPASTSVITVGGDVKVEFPEPINADITARSVKGTINSTLPDLVSSSGHVLQSRVGAGLQKLRISTQSGAVTLAPMSLAASGATSRRFSEDPLSLAPPTKAAGVPAPVTDTEEINENDVIRVDSQLVTLNMSVVDRNTNRGLMGLEGSDFRLFENGVEQKILQFESSAAPFDLLLLIDLSGSTRDKVTLIRAAALRFINAARPFDRIGVVTFAGQPTVVSPLTLDRELLRDRVSGIATERVGDTKLYDATDFASTLLLRESQNKRRTAIVLFSDGLDGSIEGVQGDGSRIAYEEFIRKVQEFDGVLYTLWLNTRYVALNERDTQPEAFDDGHDQMQEMAESGGGLFYEVDRLQDLAGAYERVVADLGTVYSLAYRPSDKARDGRWRAIKVNVNRPAAVARGKRGYYAN